MSLLIEELNFNRNRRLVKHEKLPFQMIFLLGIMRSGTTYFRNILASNPNILALPGELNEFWTDYGCAPCGLTRVCPPMNATDLKIGVRKQVLNFFIKEYQSRNCLKRILYRIYRKVRYRNETIIKNGAPFYILNKSTHLLNKIPYLDAIFPQARFIFIIRDIFSQSNSLKEHFRKLQKSANLIIEYPQANGECWRFHTADAKYRKPASIRVNFKNIPKYWMKHNVFAMRALSDIDNNRKMFVNYHDLVNKPDGVLLKLENFLEIKHLNSHVSRRLVNNLTSDPLNEWRYRLSNKEIMTISKIIDSCPDDYRYIWAHCAPSEK